MKSFIFSAFVIFQLGFSQTPDEISFNQALSLIPDAESDTSLKAMLKNNPKARLLIWRMTKVSASVTLGIMGYGTGPFTYKYSDREKNAITKFQKDFGLTVTGSLNKETIKSINLASKVFSKEDPYLSMFYFQEIGQFISAEGSWKADNFEPLKSINRQIITCNLSTSECRVTNVDLSDDHKQLSLNEDFYDIKSVGKDLVIAEHQNQCTKELLILKRKLKEVQYQRITTKKDGMCSALDENTLTMKLVDGKEIMSVQSEKKKKYFNAMMSNSDLPEVMQELLKIEK